MHYVKPVTAIVLGAAGTIAHIIQNCIISLPPLILGKLFIQITFFFQLIAMPLRKT